MTAEKPITGNGRLTPTEALGQFTPTQGTLTGQSQTQTEEARFGIRIGDVGLLLAPRLYSEVLETAMVHPMPTTPNWFRGILNLRGNLVPVFDLGQLFGGKLDEGVALGRLALRAQTERLLILDKGERSIGIVIDTLPRTVSTSHRLGQLPPLPDRLNGHVSGSFEHDGEVWLEFDHVGFFEAVGTQVAA
jgi:twitching motility protein PilI